LHDLKSDIISEQENLSLKVKEQVNLKFKSEGYKIQFRFNEEIAADLAKLQKHCTSSVNNSLVTDICDKLKSRNKLIRIADTSAGGWATVREYEQNEIADNSDDEKRIRQAENRAIKHIKDKGKIHTTPYSRYSTPARSETRPNFAKSVAISSLNLNWNLLPSLLNFKLTCSLTFKDKFSCSEIISDFKSCNFQSTIIDG
jgi:hypothetical protein